MSSHDKGRFITIEGIEGVGKSTALRLAGEVLKKENVPTLLTREPGGTPIAELIRQILLNPNIDEKLLPESELLLMFAARAQHFQNVILPAINEGTWVICDRFTDATYAYQGAGRGIDRERIAWLESWVQNEMYPDLTIILDAPVDVALQRAKKRSLPDRFEQETHQFFERVRECYLQRAEEWPTRYEVIDATLPLDEVQEHLKNLLHRWV